MYLHNFPKRGNVPTNNIFHIKVPVNQTHRGCCFAPWPSLITRKIRESVCSLVDNLPAALCSLPVCLHTGFAVQGKREHPFCPGTVPTIADLDGGGVCVWISTLESRKHKDLEILRQNASVHLNCLNQQKQCISQAFSLSVGFCVRGLGVGKHDAKL